MINNYKYSFAKSSPMIYWILIIFSMNVIIHPSVYASIRLNHLNDKIIISDKNILNIKNSTISLYIGKTEPKYRIISYVKGERSVTIESWNNYEKINYSLNLNNSKFIKNLVFIRKNKKLISKRILDNRKEIEYSYDTCKSNNAKSDFETAWNSISNSIAIESMIDESCGKEKEKDSIKQSLSDFFKPEKSTLYKCLNKAQLTPEEHKLKNIFLNQVSDMYNPSLSKLKITCSNRQNDSEECGSYDPMKSIINFKTNNGKFDRFFKPSTIPKILEHEFLHFGGLSEKEIDIFLINCQNKSLNSDAEHNTKNESVSGAIANEIKSSPTNETTKIDVTSIPPAPTAQAEYLQKIADSRPPTEAEIAPVMNHMENTMTSLSKFDSVMATMVPSAEAAQSSRTLASTSGNASNKTTTSSSKTSTLSHKKSVPLYYDKEASTVTPASEPNLPANSGEETYSKPIQPISKANSKTREAAESRNVASINNPKSETISNSGSPGNSDTLNKSLPSTQQPLPNNGNIARAPTSVTTKQTTNFNTVATSIINKPSDPKIYRLIKENIWNPELAKSLEANKIKIEFQRSQGKVIIGYKGSNPKKALYDTGNGFKEK